MVKLTPNAANIVEIAQSVENAGADIISLVNTFLGMAIDVATATPLLATVTGGLSGPAIKPIALRMVWEVAQAVSIPVVGMGGVTTGRDALEFIIAGARAVQVGTANFINPAICIEIIQDLERYLEINNIESIDSLVGSLKIPSHEKASH
jgi:dihydroorotate dehydrogenase (NAD+) catalytic subunit